MGRDITKLHPELQAIVKRFKDECAKQGLKVTITETHRTVAEQNALYAKGRTTGGKIVTKCKGTDYQSGHQWGVAFDIFQSSIDSKKWYEESFFKKCAVIGNKLGLKWGGEFRGFPDSPHFEMPKCMPNCSTTTLRSKYGIPEAFIATWTGEHSHDISEYKVPQPVKVQPQPNKYPTLKQGDKGENVKQLQQLLNNNSAKLVADGQFGGKTLEAVKTYQKAKGLVVDGIAGNKTITSLVGK